MIIAQISDLHIKPKGQMAYRVVDTATALDLSIDGGVASFFSYDKFPYDSTSTASGLIAVNLAVGWGL